MFVVGGQVDGPADGSRRPLPIVEDALRAQARDERQVDRIARFELFERVSFARGEERVPQRNNGRRLTLDDLNEHGPRQPPREGRLGDPRVGQQTVTRGVEIGSEDVDAHGDPTLGDEGGRGAAVVSHHLYVRHRETVAGHHVAARRPRDTQGRPHDERDAKSGAHDGEHTRRARGPGCWRRKVRRRGARDLRQQLLRFHAAILGGHRGGSPERVARSSRTLALMSPAPSAMTMSPGSMTSSNAAATFFLSRTNVTA